jgi:hypothetical protein
MLNCDRQTWAKLPRNVLICILFYFVGLAGAFSQTINDAQIVDHPNCLSAYKGLPIDFSTGEPQEDKNGAMHPVGNDPVALHSHFVKHAQAWIKYDNECFYPWNCKSIFSKSDCLQTWTRNVLRESAGVLFREYAYGKFQPYCSAFRITEHKIVTAAHCVAPLMTFRLLGDPKWPLKVTIPRDNEDLGIPNTDLNDFAILDVESSKVKFTLKGDVFSRATVDKQFIAIISINMSLFEAKQLQPEHWADAVRFTRLDSSRMWSFDEAKDRQTKDGLAISDFSPDPMLRAECIIHRAPTLPGMSGAPILAVRLAKDPAASPSITIVGIHLRNGAPGSACGEWKTFNVGLRLPTRILKLVEPSE